MSVIDKELAEKIAKKLKARFDRSPKAHDLALVYEDAILIATFGIRRGSKKGLGHDHMLEALRVTAREAKDLGHCPMSRDRWLGIYRDREPA